MAQSSWPYANSATPGVTASRWEAMARLWRRSGVVAGSGSELAVSAVTDALQVTVASGEAWIDGHYYENTSAVVLNLDTADLNNDRIDLIVVRSTLATGEAVVGKVTGTPATTPVAPTPTQDHETAGVYEEVLAEVLVAAAAGNVNGQVTDRRTLATFNGDYAEDLQTEATDTSLILKPDGAGGVAFGSGSSGGGQREEYLGIAAEQNVRIWQLEADMIGVTESLTGWAGEAFLIGQDEVASAAEVAIARAALLDDGAATFLSLGTSVAADRGADTDSGANSSSFGLAVQPTGAGLTGLRGTLGASCAGITRARIIDDTDDAVVGTATYGTAVNGGETFDVEADAPLVSGRTYRFVVDNQGDSYTRSYRSSTGYPHAGSHVDIVARATDVGTQNDYPMNVQKVEGIGSATTGEGTVQLDAVALPTTCDAVYIVDDRTEDGATVTYEVSLDGGSTFGTVTDVGELAALAHSGSSLVVRAKFSRTADPADDAYAETRWFLVYATTE